MRCNYCTFVLTAVSLAVVVTASPNRASGEPLTRRASFAAESYPNIDVEYGELVTTDGAVLRTIATKPASSKGRRPAVHFLQWLSCDSVELAPTSNDGWSQMMRRLVTESQALVLRVDKAGVGDSRGPPCHTLDYVTELKHHREAHQMLRQRADVDPKRIVIFGASMGSNFAPLVAQDQTVRGIAVWGGGARSWFERLLAFDRRAMELGGVPPAAIAARMIDHTRFHLAYLVNQESPTVIGQRDPSLQSVWQKMVGADGDAHYGRPLAFHRQAQAANWAAAWHATAVPVLALLGEYDWFEEPRSAQWIAEIAQQRQVNAGQFVLIPKMDHHFVIYPSADAAFHEKDGTANPDAVMNILLPWLRERLQ